MKVWNSIETAEAAVRADQSQTAVTIGNFDGVHRGHQAIMAKVIEFAKAYQLFAIVLTFSNHTDSILGETPPLINTPAIRQALLAAQGVDALLEVEFNSGLANLEPAEFFEKWLIQRLHAQAIVIGHDFRFGSGGKGDFQLLTELCQQYHIRLERVPPVNEDGLVISSSVIRQCLLAGELEKANRFLGYSFRIEAEVVAGEQRGRKMGFPTANLQLEKGYLLPCYGVYLVQMLIDGQRIYGVASVGLKPTFDGKTPLVEVYLLDVTMNLYHRIVRVEFLHFIRPEVRFNNMEDLQIQIQQDVQMARKLIATEHT